MTTVAENLRNASETLKSGGVAEPPREASSLMDLVLGRGATFLYAHPEYLLTDEEQIRFNKYVQRRSAREPLQHITGKQEFYGLDFAVTPDVLIPRPETEMIVDTVLSLFADQQNIEFCEIGVGSGCISVAILHHLKDARAIGFDISQTALDIAEQNAVAIEVADRLELAESDVFSALDNSLDVGLQFDLIVSNPPYIPAADIATLQPEVRDHDPLSALTDGDDGLSIIRELVTRSSLYLKPGGYLLIEIGIGQDAAVGEMVDSTVWQEFEIVPDLQGIPRMVKLQIKS